MFFELNVILCAICIGLNLILLLLNYKSYLKHRAYIERFSVLLQTIIILGLGFFFLTLLTQSLVIYFFTLLIVSWAFGVNIFGFMKMIEISGEERPRREKTIIGIFLFVAFSIILTVYAFNIRIEIIEGNIYLGLNFIYLAGGIIILILPQIHLLAITIRKFLKVYEENLRIPFILFIVALFFYLSALFAVLAFVEIRIIAYSLLIGALIIGILLNLKYPDLLAELDSSFAYQSLYIIRNNGQTIFQKEFAPVVDKIKDSKIINYLIGGFIYAIKSGLQEIMKEEESGTRLHTMDFGKIQMAFSYGNYIFGVLFSQDVNKVICTKLQNCIKEFEETYDEFLKTNQSINLMERSEISEEDREMRTRILELLKKYFRG